MIASISQGIVALGLIVNWVRQNLRAKRFGVAMGPYRHQLLLAIFIVGCMITAAGAVWFARQPSRARAEVSPATAPQNTPAPITPSHSKSDDQTKPTLPNLSRNNRGTSTHPAKIAPAQPGSQTVGGVDCTQSTGNCAGINNGQQIVVGELPKRITPQTMPAIVKFLNAASPKCSIEIAVDQFSGNSRFPDDIWQAFHDSGWDMKGGGVGTHEVEMPEGTRFQGVFIEMNRKLFDAGQDPLLHVVQLLDAQGVKHMIIGPEESNEEGITLDFVGGVPPQGK